MKKKKSQAFNIKGIFIALIFCLIAIVVLICLFTGKFDFCTNNPDKCVCVEWCTEYRNHLCVDMEQKCYKLTPEELLEKDCKENPREDKDCKCVEYNVEQFLDYRLVSPKNTVNIEDLGCKYQLPLIGGVDCTTKITHNISGEWTESFEYRNETTCTSSIPKTPCEKGDKDWIEDEVLDYFDKSDCSKFGVVSTNGYESDLVYCGEGQAKEVNKTICRQKTEVEKLMDKDCDELNYKYVNCVVKHNYATDCIGHIFWEEYKDYECLKNKNDCINIREARTQKGCEI